MFRLDVLSFSVYDVQFRIGEAMMPHGWEICGRVVYRECEIVSESRFKFSFNVEFSERFDGV